MGLFSRKKKMMAQPVMPSIPLYPNVASSESAHVEPPPTQASLPPREQLRPLPPGISLPRVDTSVLDIPPREPAFLKPKNPYPERGAAARGEQLFEKPRLERPAGPLPLGREPRGLAVDRQDNPTTEQHHNSYDQGFSDDQDQRPAVVSRHQEIQVRRPTPVQSPVNMTETVVGDKPVFVKLENYREALSTIDALKTKIKEMDDLLQKIEDVRAQEQQQLQSAKEGLAKVKESLLSVDKQLFEV